MSIVYMQSYVCLKFGTYIWPGHFEKSTLDFLISQVGFENILMGVGSENEITYTFRNNTVLFFSSPGSGLNIRLD